MAEYEWTEVQHPSGQRTYDPRTRSLPKAGAYSALCVGTMAVLEAPFGWQVLVPESDGAGVVGGTAGSPAQAEQMSPRLVAQGERVLRGRLS